MDFDWDISKAARNFAKHRVSFEEAITVFADPLAKLIYDQDHSDYEDRFRLLGTSNRERLLVITHHSEGENVRIINARKATKREVEEYG